ncbi:MAG: hypothetical protein WCX74_03355 [Candidatus Paceibacterota bacterium]
MNTDEDIIKLGNVSIEVVTPYIEKYLGSVPEYRVEFRDEQKGGRSDVDFNIEGLGLFVFFYEGIKQRLLVPIQNKDMRSYTVANWVNGTVHELIHLHQEPYLKNIYKDEAKRNDYFEPYHYWLDGFAEHLAWKVSASLYEDAQEEDDYWDNRSSLEDVYEAIKLRRYKTGIKQRIVQLAVWYYFLLRNRGLEKYFELPDFLPQEIKDETWKSIKEEKLFFEIAPFAKERFGMILNRDKETTDLWFPYAIGFICIGRLVKNGATYSELLTNPKDNKELLEMAGIPESKDED